MTASNPSRLLIIVQARMTSTRLPGKVLFRVRGRTLLDRLLERLRHVEIPHRTVVATTTNATDDAIVAEATRCGAGVYRGSESDVLERYRATAEAFDGHIIVRITSDCPLMDPLVVTEVIRAFDEAAPPADYASNTLGARTYPRGLDVEVMTRTSLETAAEEAAEHSYREHVTPYIYQSPERFRLLAVTNDRDMSDHRWTVDFPEDFALVRAIIEELEPRYRRFGMEEIVALLDDRPDLMAINRHVAQKALGI